MLLLLASLGLSPRAIHACSDRLHQSRPWSRWARAEAQQRLQRVQHRSESGGSVAEQLPPQERRRRGVAAGLVGLRVHVPVPVPDAALRAVRALPAGQPTATQHGLVPWRSTNKRIVHMVV